MKIRILSILMGFVGALQAQVNLVPNPSFEDTVRCIDSGNYVDFLTYWSNPTSGTPDIHSIDWCNNYGYSINISLPNNPYFGYQSPRTGRNCAGIAVFDDGVDMTREYLQVKLTDELKPNTAYCVEFYVSEANKFSRFAIKNLGLHFNMDSTYVGGIDYPVVTYSQNNIMPDFYIGDTLNWVKISGVYQAQGGEEYILIGNFALQSQTDYIINYSNISSHITYYYIDDVSVFECDSLTDIEETRSNKINIYPNPASDFITINTGVLQDVEIELFDIAGRKLLQQNASNTINISGFANGIYICRVNSKGRIVKREKVIISR